ncbi:CD209 antigen-like protein C isoform X2 [Dunckerocampus dactyliophorus]|uniref:CD209 antigen-like protein C isoform X2 n=1 Tax=Dunckerocampus dactyliophorus TaxID=161453 RepID=UPI0024066312|nr:CD209 antigen-like protein C isoform X2 [Dunckerocampus dactyliophorus]
MSNSASTADSMQCKVYALKNSPFRAATLCLELLCVVLVTGLMGQSVHCQGVSKDTRTLTLEKANLQATYTTPSNATDELMASYNSTVEEKQECEKTLKNVTAERDLQRMVITNLTAEVEQLRAAITILKAMKDKTCPSGWKKFGTSCYYSSPTTTKKTWSQSRSDCQAKGADLVIINSQEEKEFVNGLYSSYNEVWLGLTNHGIKGQWKWVDGTSLTTAYWAPGQPNGFVEDQDCVEFFSSEKAEWFDDECKAGKYWVCEM